MNTDERISAIYFVFHLKTYVRAFSLSSSRILYSVFMAGLYQRTYPEKICCKVCQACFTRSDSLTRHMHIHSGKKNRFHCELCPAGFFSLSDLERHARIHTGEKPIKCDICKKKFNVKENMVTHRKTHYDVKPFQCELCSYKSSTE